MVRRPPGALALLPLLGGIACWPGPLPECPQCSENDDQDGDGFTPAEGDCADGAAAVSPLAEEVCNGLDDDCDGEVDGASAADALPWYVDADGDGWGTGAAVMDCAPGAGWSLSGGDCDDGQPDVSPGASERCSNGVDDDCNGDDDGCIRAGDVPLQVADALLPASEAGASLGASLARVPDRDRDGDEEILVGASGWGALFTGAVLRVDGRDLWSDADIETVASFQAPGARSGDTLGVRVAASAELLAARASGLLGESSGGEVYLFANDIEGITDDVDVAAQAHLIGESGEQLGLSMAMDEAGGLLLTSEIGGRAAWWVPTPPVGEVWVGDVGLPLLGDALVDAVAVADLSGDGVSDLVLGASTADVDGRTAAGAVAFLEGPISAALSLLDADGVVAGDDAGDRAGGALAVLSDLDGDGRVDLFVGAPEGGDGEAWVLPGDVFLQGTLSSSGWLHLEGTPETRVGFSAATTDLDGNGWMDLAVGAPADPLAGASAGRVFVRYGPLAGGRVALEDSDLRLSGEGANHAAGAALVGADVDGDGLGDLVIGVPGESSLAENGGAVVVVLGRGL